ncbi:prostaglandin E2 receptor EP2 subtype-like [Sinocyclocheilus anshuiensis]|uniref:prostaglandin E2 receptor EP2 subtype-like n=1 Tax=Sinocyclocheilus anshuiensis TaxID=1608454 RepID=UPI0007B80B2E|nr:PREDICTED: prostaglandin E2 receptor EP2 subtype-like [Sinocyclocheilus anshuiensis]
MASEPRNVSCHEQPTVSGGSPTTPAIMFSAGVLGNVVALILLEIRRRKQPASLFQVLVTSLVFTDLLGTFSVSPLVLTAYLRNESLIGMSESRLVCGHFGYAMTFFSMVTLAILLSMAVERWLSIGHPYCYEKRMSKRCGYITIALIYLFCALFSATPFFGFGKYVQYCPGTWCFIDMHPSEREHKVFNIIYASCLLIMIVCTVLCNASVIYHLSLMYRRRKAHRSSVRRQRGHKRHRSIAKEVEHLVLLGFMTIAFVICSLPHVIQVYFNISYDRRHKNNLIPLLLVSANPIIDPWVFIILSPPVPRLLWNKMCKTAKFKPTQEQVRSIHPDLYQSNPPGDSV